MDVKDTAKFLEASAWKISETIQSLSSCPHVSRQPEKPWTNLCCICMNIQAKLGLISVRLASDPDAFSNPDVQRDGSELLRILEAASSVSTLISNLSSQLTEKAQTSGRKIASRVSRRRSDPSPHSTLY